MKPFSMPIVKLPERASEFAIPVYSCPFMVAVALPRHRYLAAPLTLGSSASCSSRKRNPDPPITDHCHTDSLPNLLRSHSVHTAFTLFTLFFKGGGGRHSFRHVAGRSSLRFLPFVLRTSYWARLRTSVVYLEFVSGHLGLGKTHYGAEKTH